MSWNYQNSLERVESHLKSIGEIQVEKLIRDADLYTLLSETNCRDIFGAHVYIDVTNFSRIASNVDGEDYRRIIQAIHLYQREVTRIVENDDMFGGVRIHFQGPRLHALFFRPIDSGEDLAAKAFLVQIVLRQFVTTVFKSAFPALPEFEISGGADLGRAIGTKNGARGDRELLFLGAPANHAAKILGNSGEMNMTANVFDVLPKKLQALCRKISDEKYQIGSTNGASVQELVDAFGMSWDPDASAARLEDEKRQFPLKDIEYSGAESLIDLDSLSITNNKRVLAASVFADVSGFTAFVDGAQTTDAKKRAVRVFHVIRKELATVVKVDFVGLRIQYQGDRVQALIHLPEGEDAAITQNAVELAAGLQSSMDYVLHTVLPDSIALGLAIGVDLDTTLASKTGTRGQRDRICVGLGVENAARIQEFSNGTEVSLSVKCYSLLSANVQKLFAFDEVRKFYVARNLYANKFELLARAAVYSAGSTVAVRTSNRIVVVDHREGSGGSKILPSKSYCE